jgi:hypothetical protein
MTMLEGSSLVARFCRGLKVNGATVRAGVSEARVCTFEERNQVALPADMRSFYLGVDGMDDEFPFESFVRVLSLDEVAPVKHEFPGYRPPDAFLIGDACIGSYFYAIDVSGAAGPAGSVYVAGSPPRLVADSFGEFIDEVLTDSRRLHHDD